MVERAKQVREKYNNLNSRKHNGAWGPEQLALGFGGDFGDLLKLIMAKEGRRSIDGDVDAKLVHELCDCLWSLLVLAKYYQIELGPAFLAAMDSLEERVDAGLSQM
jgi:NTP pyrophosphatase (non-canonical NTP hydrolase)